MSAIRNTAIPQNNQSSKRTQSYQSLNHLTNFSLPPRAQHVQAAPRRSRRPLTQQVWNKEKFVNAQYRFVMKPTGDYTVHFADPDIFFQWEDILQVIIPPSHTDAPDSLFGDLEQLQSTSEQTACPICLTSPPVAPRVTKCGHIFCFPCILRYLQMGSNPKWNRCPICFDSVNEKHLKCVAWDDKSASSSWPPIPSIDAVTNPYTTTLTMRLIERPQITTLALPRSSSWPSDLIPPHQAPFHFLPDVSTFAKFMLATPSYIVAGLTLELDQIDREREVLQSDEFKDAVGLNFINAAAEKVKRQIDKALALESHALQAEVEKAERGMREHEQIQRSRLERAATNPNDSELATPDAFLSLHPLGFASGSSPPQTPAVAPPRAPRIRRNLNPPPHSTSTYFFYQSAAGAPVFLHPLDIRILLAHFKSYTSFPDTITFATTPQSYTTSTINDDLRKRCKYLAHLPEGADVVFVEAGWELESVVGVEGVKPFEGALKMRLGKRKEREKKDDRAKLKAEEKERESILRSTVRTSAMLDQRPVSPALSDFTPPPASAATQSIRPAVSGVWGNRSFATAISATSTTSTSNSARRSNNRPREEDAEWELEIDAAWHDLESSMDTRGGGGNGGGKKRKGGKKLVLLTGGGGRRN